MVKKEELERLGLEDPDEGKWWCGTLKEEPNLKIGWWGSLWFGIRPCDFGQIVWLFLI